MTDRQVAELDPMVALLHEARCGPESWKGNEHAPWSDDHHEWDAATVKALRLLGVSLERVAAALVPDSLDVEGLARIAADHLGGALIPMFMFGAPLEEGAGGGRIDVPLRNRRQADERAWFVDQITVIAREYAALREGSPK